MGLSPFQRDAKENTCARTGAALYVDIPGPIGNAELLMDIAQSEAPPLDGPLTIDLTQQGPQILGRDPDAVVGHLKEKHVAFFLKCDLDSVLRGAFFKTVDDGIFHNGLKEVGGKLLS